VTLHPAARSLPRALGIITVAILAASLLSEPPPVSRWGAWLRELPIRLTTPNADFSGVAIVDIADPVLRQEATQYGLAPYRRETLARIAGYLTDNGARAVALDLLFVESQADDLEAGRLLGPNTVLAAAALPYYPRAQDPPRRELAGLGITVNTRLGATLARTEWQTIELPAIALLQNASTRVGVANLNADADGKVRRQPLLHASPRTSVLPSLPLAALIAAERSIAPIEQRGGSLALGMHKWPVTAEGEALIRFPANANEVRSLSAHRIALAAYGLRSDPELAAMVRDRVIFIGNSSAATGPSIATPVGHLSTVQLAAVSYTQLSKGAVAAPTSWWWNGPLTLLACLPGLAFLLRSKLPNPRQIALAVLAAVGIAVAGAVISGFAGIMVRWPLALLAGVISVGLSVAWLATQVAARRRQRRQDRLAANEATRLKTEFLNHLTHELRTPLTAIMGFNKINQFTDELGKDSRIGNSAVIARNCEHLLALINNNLDLAKIESGQLAIQRSPEDPEQIMRDVIATMRALAADKKLEMRYVKRTPLPEGLLLDAFRLRQVLINLMGNAVKFTGKGQVELAVAWHVAALEVEVRDTGPGIAPEALERIWQPFKQADLTIGRRFGGTGLGLAISRKLVEMMGGEISVDSKLGAGTTFRVRLPSEEVILRTIPADSHVPPPALVPRERLTGRVLLADDNEDLRHLVTLFLKNLGLTVHAVENGLVAVEAALSEEFDVILMDMEMPVMNGYEAVHVLRTRGYSGTIFGLTAHQDGPEVARAILSGCDTVVSKPVSIDILKAALAPALERRAGRDTPARRERKAAQHG
jgi:signal transduction histidine kinase/AmiR/NasT family two-component response regulator